MALGDPAPETLLGRLALHYKLITREQLVEATTVQAVEGGRLGDLLVARGWVTPQQLAQLLKVQQQVMSQERPAGVAPATGTPAAGGTVAPPPAPGQAAMAALPSGATVSGPSLLADATASGTKIPPVRAATSGRSEIIFSFLEAAGALNASDVHIHAGSPLRMRVNGKLQEVGRELLTGEQTKVLLDPLLDDENRQALATHGQVEFALTVSGVGRFRVAAYRQQRGTDVVFRVISEQSPTLASLGLPGSLSKFVNFHQGLVLVTGPAGCGKSSTLAALVDIVNEERHDHIITVEDPIEYLHVSKSCVVNQRQVGKHTDSFARALRAALREDPDVIAIGELRDLETISLALTAAETGHLVLATLHTPSTMRTINRILGVFPPEQQAQVRMMVSESLRAVISQRLVTKAEGKGRVPALEILINNKAVSNLIRDEKTFQIYSVLQTGSTHGMCLLDQSLLQLVKAGTITKEEARRHADEPKAFA
jgi:twitching motility protein PilT